MKKTLKTVFLTAVFTMAAALSVLASDFTLFDAYTPESELKIANFAVTQEQLNRLDSSLRLKMNDGNSGAEVGKAFSEPQNYSANKYFNLSVYSPKASESSKFTVDLYTADGSGNKVKFASATVITDWMGWKSVSIPYDLFKYETGYDSTDWSSVIKYRVTSYSTRTTWEPGDCIYIEKAWLSTDDLYAVEENSLIIDPAQATLANYWKLNGEQTRVLKKSLKVYSYTSRTENSLTLEKPINISDANFLNIWVYCEKDPTYNTGNDVIATPQLKIRLNDGSVTSQTDSKSGPKLYKQGWQLVSVKLADLSKWGTFDKKNLTKFIVITNETGNTVFNEKFYLYFDKIWFSETLPSENEIAVTGVKSESGDSNFRSLDKTAVITLGRNAWLKNASGINITKDDTSVSASAVMTDAGKLTLVFENTLESGKEYNINIAEDTLMDGNGFGNTTQSVSFTARPGELTCAAPVLYAGNRKLNADSANNIKALTKIYNTTNQEKNIMLFAAVYDSSNTLKAASVKEFSVGAGSSVTADTNSKTLSKGENDTIRCFVWEKSLSPLTQTK